ncbi:hypothetical protein [Streptomyces sp. NPDC059761]|uniref:hypothetical protein n=1 Tax=Streptomyces sp. NPDC059761 TaxID=3346937 RepID=UPI00365BD759
MATTELPYYVDDPAMDEERSKHHLDLEVKEQESAWKGFTVYSASCRCNGWFSGALYDQHGHAELYDEHMRRIQEQVHDQAGGQ